MFPGLIKAYPVWEERLFIAFCFKSEVEGVFFWARVKKIWKSPSAADIFRRKIFLLLFFCLRHFESN